MAKRAFLKPLSAVIAALTSAIPWAAKANVQSPTSLSSNVDQQAAVDPTFAPIAVNEARDVLVRQNGDLFKFVLKRGGDGRFLAYHQSHSSHGSHGSHSSHSSHYSGR